ncbi:tripartite tricarboxylate transporter permease [Devosia ginsengisoli]|uniref:tripartite tricarboxylate transporter permease n=1 Tax=Devosia ginsengisoli TaxID=400770 RepID=UPI003CCC5DB6
MLPGIGPALTVALLLPVTYKLDPAGSLIMFAGIYYGGMYGGSTTSILLNTPGESAFDRHRARGQQDGPPGAGVVRRSPPPPSAPSSPGSSPRWPWPSSLLWVVKFALAFGPAEYFALMVLAFITVSAAFGDSALRGLTALFIGLGLGIIGIDLQTGQARMAFGIPDLLDGIEVTTLAVALFAIGETLKMAADRTAVDDEVIAVKGLGVDDQGRLEAQLATLVARHGCRLSHRRHAGRRRRCRQLPQLQHRKDLRQESRRVSAMAPSKASPARRPPITPRLPVPWCRC